MTDAPPSPALVAVQRLVVRSARGPVRRLWAGLYALTAAAAGRYLTRGEPNASSYLRSGLGAGDLVPGLSDIDLAFILEDDPRGADVASARVRQRYERLVARVPLAGRIIDVPGIYEQGLVERLAGASFATWGLDGRGGDDPVYPPGPARLNRCRLLERPGLYADFDDWRLRAGPNRLPAPPARDEDDRLAAAWMELSFWWRFAFESSQAPDRIFVPRVCMKLVAESARVRLWLETGERLDGRRQVLRRFQEAYPDQAAEVEPFLALLEDPLRLADPPLAAALRFLAEQTHAAAAAIAEVTAARGSVSVELLGVDPIELLGSLSVIAADDELTRHDPGALPICDWRALASPDHVEDAFVVLPGSIFDPHALAAAARERRGGMYRALLDEDVLVFPLPVLDPPKPRRLSCAATDPVTFALLANERTAEFPLIRGWAVHDVARRAVMEQKARLTLARALEGEGERATRILLSAARAGLLLESVELGEPKVAVTLSAVITELGDRDSTSRAVAEEARAVVSRSSSATSTGVRALHDLVGALPAFSR